MKIKRYQNGGISYTPFFRDAAEPTQVATQTSKTSENKEEQLIQKEIINGEQYRSISLEAINEYAGDMIMIGGWQEDPMDLVGNNSVWNSTPAVKNQKVITYDSSAYIYQDILSTKEQLKNITQSILALYE